MSRLLVIDKSILTKNSILKCLRSVQLGMVTAAHVLVQYSCLNIEQRRRIVFVRRRVYRTWSFTGRLLSGGGGGDGGGGFLAGGSSCLRCRPALPRWSAPSSSSTAGVPRSPYSFLRFFFQNVFRVPLTLLPFNSLTSQTSQPLPK